MFTAIIAIIIGYLFGSVPFGLVYTKLAGHGDIREQGSGNIGATNVLRTGNKWIAILTLLSDGLKGYIAILIVQKIFHLPSFDHAILLAGLASIYGHIFPVWLRFKGGKGVATCIGVLFSLYWPIALAVCLTWMLAARITRISSLSALIAATLCPFYAIITTRWDFVIMCVILTLTLYYTHRENLTRIRDGVEPRIGA